MREQTAFSLMKGAGMTPQKAVAISKLFSVEDDTPEIREHLVADMEKAGISPKGAHILLDIFLERWKPSEKSH